MILVFLSSLRPLAIAIDTAWPSRNNVRFDENVRMVIRGSKGISFIGGDCHGWLTFSHVGSATGIHLSRFELGQWPLG
jgi:hypothetical protein